MNKSLLITLIAVGVFVIIFPLYGIREVDRMQEAQGALREQHLTEAANLYVESCGTCHGASGEGLGVTPALNNDGLRKAEHEYLFKMISHPPHGTAMSIWHIDEAINLSEYQVESLITFIRHTDWDDVSNLAAARNLIPDTNLPADIQQVSLTTAALDNPHECIACHEQPKVHADRFGLNCARCHSIQAWQPALLSYHAFDLKHGDATTNIACNNCHPTSYSEHTCYGCHDHQPQDMEEVHAKEGINSYEYCAVCHPTGVENEGSLYTAGYEQRVQALVTAIQNVSTGKIQTETSATSTLRCLPMPGPEMPAAENGISLEPAGPQP